MRLGKAEKVDSEPPKKAELSKTSNPDRLTVEIIKEVIRFCKQRNWPVLAIVVKYGADRLRPVEELLTKSGVASIVVPTKGERPDLYYPVDGHWNAKGHAVVADYVLAQLS